jgi:N,N'-diacetyllegionaminate synthase
MCIQLDTGNATLGEIESAVDVIRSEGNESIIIHQCPSGYPARIPSINLNIIKTLKQMFPYPAAFSDHTPGLEMDVAALVLGANLLEKTITEDRTTRSVEHIFSLEPREMSNFVRVMRDVEAALGENRRLLQSAEIEKRRNIRRSVFLKSGAIAGQTLGEIEVDFRRPGHGIAPDAYESLKGLRFARNFDAGHMVRLEDFS